MRIVLSALALLALGACEKSSGSGPKGQERGDCYGNGTCDVGLVCMSNLCVRPPPADCAPVAQKLASYRLGNYAPREERDKVVAELTAACADAKLSVEEGKCITEATTRFEVAKCPRPLLAELTADADGCKGVADVMSKALLDGFAKLPEQRKAAEPLVPELTAALAASCVEDLWPDAAKQCVLSAKNFDAMGDCDDAFGRDSFERIGQRLMPVLEKIMNAVSAAGPDAAPLPPPPPPMVDAGVPGTQPSTGSSLFEQACSGYVQAMETYLECDKFPDGARKAARDALDQMRQSFDQMGGGQSPEVVKAMSDACAQGETAIRDAMKSLGC